MYLVALEFKKELSYFSLYFMQPEVQNSAHSRCLVRILAFRLEGGCF